jgi:large subunit ribosomal protein L30
MSVTITQVKSKNGCDARQLAALRTLGLRKIGQSVEREESPQLKGNLAVVAHLVSVEDPS